MSKKFLSLLAVSTLALAACGGTTPTDDTSDTSSSAALEGEALSSDAVAVDSQTWTDADGTMLRYNADTKMLEGSVDGTTYVEVPGNMWKGSDNNWYKFDETGAVMMSADEGQTWEAVTQWESNGVTYTVLDGQVTMSTGDAAGTVEEGSPEAEDMGAAGEVEGTVAE